VREIAKKAYRKKAFESAGVSWDTSANIFMSMLKHPAFRDMTPRQQILYVYCKAQYYGTKGRDKPRYVEGTVRVKGEAPDTQFYFNRSKWCIEYELYTDKDRASFYRDRDALISHGFIRVIENGKTTRTKTIYAFWDMWQQWGQPDFEVKPADMSTSMLNALRKKKETDKNPKEQPPQSL